MLTGGRASSTWNPGNQGCPKSPKIAESLKDSLRHELPGDRVLRTTCATSCTAVASSVQLASRVVRWSRPPYNLRHELYGGRVLRTTCATSCTAIASSVQLAPRVVRRSRPPTTCAVSCTISSRKQL